MTASAAPSQSEAHKVPQPSIEGMSFEQALGELERIVEQLEGGAVDLEQSITLYERGTRLKEHCDAKLKSAQSRIDKIVSGPDGGPHGGVDAVAADLN
ncbi:MAG: exodeoxyribonuclease VII small subunit [Alphaproteobacteria bacterium]